MIEIRYFEALRGRLGEEIGVSDWIPVTQERINLFAEATGDHQWIHIDTARAAAESPFKATIAHGFLTLSLTSVILRSTCAFPDLRMAINYGLNRVRFIAPVVAGSRVRGRVSPVSIEQAGGGIQVVWRITIETDAGGNEPDGGKPCCVAEWIVRYFPS